MRGLAKYYMRSPDLLTEDEVRRFFLHLINERKAARSTVTIYLCGIKFFFEKTLGRQWPVFSLVRPQPNKKLPVVLSRDGEDFAAETVNVSASGVLFLTDRSVPVSSPIGFSLRMPGEILGTPRDVLVHCRVRVVRCYPSQIGNYTAATIDEYRFADQ